MKKLLSVVMIIGFFFVASPAHATATFDMNWDAIEYSAGSGADQALLVIDFGDTSSADSYIFGYNFTDQDSVTGYDMVTDVGTLWDGASTMDSDVLYYEETDWGEYGVFIDTFYYNGETMVTGTYWEYFVSETDTNGEFDGWTSSSVGASSRILEDESWDGWYNPGFESEGTPAVVPLPGGVLLMCTGLLGLIGIRRKRS